jgi:calcineurin-like phosphoesterase
VDFHAEATSEKAALGWYLDGRVSALVGTHTHVQTSDEKLLPKGTAYITDLGMTGPTHSVIGREIEPVLKKFITGMPSKFDVAKGAAALEGAIVEIDRVSGKPIAITRVRENAKT